MSYIDKLIRDCKKAKLAKPTSEIDVANSGALASIDKAIYVIEEIGGDPKRTFSDFSCYRAKKERACAKLNAPSQVLYVGSCTTGVAKRIEQHIGNGNPLTYALHLKHWFSGKYRVTVKEYSVSAEVLQIIEDDLSDRLQPAFGKQGKNNK